MTSSRTDPTESDDVESHLLGYSYLAVFGGLLLAGSGVLLDAALPSWIGAAIFVVATLANVAVKVAHYRTIRMSPAGRTRIVVTWALLAVSVCGLLVVGLGMQFGYPWGRYFPPLIVVSVVLLVSHRIFRGLYHPHVLEED